MTITETINLVGLKSTDPKMIQWFEKHELKKPPKTINANQGSKSFDDKQNELSYYFFFNIINEKFYPPKSPKNDDYSFDCFLTNIYLFERKKKGNIEKPIEFWEDYIHPNATYEECCLFFDKKVEESSNRGFFSKTLNELVEIRVCMTGDKKNIQSIDLYIKEENEFFSQYDFKEDNEHNTTKQGYLLVVKWLFDNRFLVLSEAIYAEGLGFKDQEIRTFIATHLRNHVWDNQIELSKEPDLYKFLFKINSNSNVTLSNGEIINVYVQNLFLQAAGVWEEIQRISNEDDYKYEDITRLEKSAFLNEEQSIVFMNTLTHFFNKYKTYKGATIFD